MKFKRTFGLILFLILACGYLVTASDTGKRSRANQVEAPEPQSPKSHLRMLQKASIPTAEQVAMLDAGKGPSLNYSIEPTPIRGKVKPRTADQEKLFQQATAIMLRFRPVPDNRAVYFDRLFAERRISLERTGWSAFVDDVTVTSAGWRIKLKVWPKIPGVVLGNAFFEEYVWNHDDLVFVKGYQDPSFRGLSIHW